MRKTTKTTVAIAALAASLATASVAYAQDTGKPGTGGAMMNNGMMDNQKGNMNGGMMGQGGNSGTMNQGDMSGMMNMMGQMSRMMETCNNMMQMAMNNPGKNPSSGNPPAAPAKP